MVCFSSLKIRAPWQNLLAVQIHLSTPPFGYGDLQHSATSYCLCSRRRLGGFFWRRFASSFADCVGMRPLKINLHDVFHVNQFFKPHTETFSTHCYTRYDHPLMALFGPKDGENGQNHSTSFGLQEQTEQTTRSKGLSLTRFREGIVCSTRDLKAWIVKEKKCHTWSSDTKISDLIVTSQRQKRLRRFFWTVGEKKTFVDIPFFTICLLGRSQHAQKIELPKIRTKGVEEKDRH